jgi:DnaJ-class molecular chaperone
MNEATKDNAEDRAILMAIARDDLHCQACNGTGLTGECVPRSCERCDGSGKAGTTLEERIQASVKLAKYNAM